MRIIVLDIAASKTGALSVLKDFYEYVINNERENEWIFLTGDEEILTAPDNCPNITIIPRPDVKKSKLHRLLFDKITGSRFLCSLSPDVVFSLQNTLPSNVGSFITGLSGGKRRRLLKCGSLSCGGECAFYPVNKDRDYKTVLYVHQPIGYQNWKKFSFFKREERELALYQKLISREIDSSVRRSDSVIVQTEWMRKALIDKCGVNPEKVIRILPDTADLSHYIDLSVSHNKKLFLYPAGPIAYKNHECIVKAVSILQEKGFSDFRVIFTLKKRELPWIKAASPLILWLGAVPRERLFKLYQASTLLFPSYVETFGFPLAEAREFNSPIIASDMPFCREVLEGYERVNYFDPFKPEELAREMQKIMLGKERVISKQSGVGNQGNSYKRIVDELLKGR